MRRLRLVLVATVLTVATMLSAGGAAAAAGFRTFVVPLVPQAPNAEGRGTAVIRINPTTDQVCYVATVQGIGQPTEPQSGLGAAHIHDIATRGLFVDLETTWMATGLDRYTTTGCTTATGASLDAILADPGAYFVNVHTVAFPGGALTGTLR